MVNTVTQYLPYNTSLNEYRRELFAERLRDVSVVREAYDARFTARDVRESQVYSISPSLTKNEEDAPRNTSSLLVANEVQNRKSSEVGVGLPQTTIAGEARKLQPPANVIPINRRKIAPEDTAELNRQRVIPLIGADQVEDVIYSADGSIDYTKLSELIDEAYQQNPDRVRQSGANDNILSVIA